jgi:hypothetical protein
MAGPVLGRLIQAELGEDFISANLPMLHKRTVESIGASEFRPGIERDQSGILVDLSGEYERQFFGDVMLFTISRLTAAGFPTQPLSCKQIQQQLQQVESELLEKYHQKHQQVVLRLTQLSEQWHTEHQWWHQQSNLNTAHKQVTQFLKNMEYNFGDQGAGLGQIESKAHRQLCLQQIHSAISSYQSDRNRWQQYMATEAV